MNLFNSRKKRTNITQHKGRMWACPPNDTALRASARRNASSLGRTQYPFSRRTANHINMRSRARCVQAEGHTRPTVRGGGREARSARVPRARKTHKDHTECSHAATPVDCAELLSRRGVEGGRRASTRACRTMDRSGRSEANQSPSHFSSRR